MTETPVLTKKQQKSTLSAKKNKSKVTLRNVLVTPYSKYWPLINAKDAEDLHEVMSNHLPEMVVKKPNIRGIPGIDFENVPKSDRKTFRKLYLKNDLDRSNEEKIKKREGVLFGVNDITKAIEQQQLVKSMLITDDVQPRFLVEHLIDLGVLFRIPTLVVPNLRTNLKINCGFSSIAIAFTHPLKYEVVQQTIGKLHVKYPVPRGHINFQRSLDLLDVIAVDDSSREPSMDKSPQCKANVAFDVSSTSGSVSECSSSYLYRKETEERVFVPEKSTNAYKNNSKMETDVAGFLSFSIDRTTQDVAKYIPLKVKKIRGDTNRHKRKIEQMRKVKKKPKK